MVPRLGWNARKRRVFLEFEGQNAPAFQLIAKRPNRKRRVSSVFPCVYFKYLVHVLALSLFLFSSCKTAEPELRTNSQEWMNQSINALYTCTKQMIFVVTSRYGCHTWIGYISCLYEWIWKHIFFLIHWHMWRNGSTNASSMPQYFWRTAIVGMGILLFYWCIKC